MKCIKFVLTERWYTWENARKEAMEDDEVNLQPDASKGEKAYIHGPDPVQVVTEEAVEDGVPEAASEQSPHQPPPDASRLGSEARI
jgi:hypothetical protein